MAVCGVGVTEPSLLDACLEARLLNLQPALKLAAIPQKCKSTLRCFYGACDALVSTEWPKQQDCMAGKCDAWDALGLTLSAIKGASCRVQCQLAEVDSTKLEHLSQSIDRPKLHLGTSR